MKNYIFLLLLLFFAGCTNKQLLIKSLQPTQITNEKLNKVFIEKLKNDEIDQTKYLEDELNNTKIENKKIFTLNTKKEQIDGIIQGEVLNSNLKFELYYEEDLSSFRCIRYQYINDRNDFICLEYQRRLIPCEKKDYTVQTQLKVLNSKNEIIFSKIYTQNKTQNECYKYTFNRNFLLYNKNYYEKEKKRVNSQLAQNIAKEFIKDISPHYAYEKVKILTSLDKKYDENAKTKFKNIIDLLDKQEVSKAKESLEELNSKLEEKSYEVLYNLALTFEYENMLKKARDYYFKANEVCQNLDDLQLINEAINRVNKNILNEQKAKLQLDNIQN